jgi:hypothetical protein
MHAVRRLFILIIFAFMTAWSGEPAQAWEPERGSTVRKAIIDALRPVVVRDLGTPVVFKTNRLNVEGDWAFISATPERGGGKGIDWSRTRYGRAIANDMMSDIILALLRVDSGSWTLVEYALGPTDVTWEEWIPKHGLARRLFDETAATEEAAPSPAQATGQLSPPAGNEQPAHPGWRVWRLADLSFETPAQWLSIDSTLAPLKLGGDPWSATFSDRPMDGGPGVMLVFSWSADEYVYSRSLNRSQILGQGRQEFAGIAGTRFSFQIRDRYNDFRGFDVVSASPVNGGTFSVGCRAPSTDWPRVADVCERILESVRLGRDAPASGTIPQTAQKPQLPEQTATASAPQPKHDTAAEAFKSFTAALEKLELYEKGKDHGDWRGGLESAQKAVELQPGQSDYWRILGYAYSLGGAEVDLASALAEEAYEKSIALDPKNTGSRMLLADLLIKRQSYSRALDNIEAALSVKPELASSPVVADICRLYIADEQIKRGAAFLQKFLASHPRSHSARLGQAILLKEENRTAEALQLAAKVATDPQAPQTDAEHAKALLKAWQG